MKMAYIRGNGKSEFLDKIHWVISAAFAFQLIQEIINRLLNVRLQIVDSLWGKDWLNHASSSCVTFSVQSYGV